MGSTFYVYNDNLDITIILEDDEGYVYREYPYNADTGYGNYEEFPHGYYTFTVRVNDENATLNTAILQETYNRTYNMTMSADKKSASYRITTKIYEPTSVTVDSTVNVDGIISTGDVLFIYNKVETGIVTMTQKDNGTVHTIPYNGDAGYKKGYKVPVRDFDVKLTIPEGFKYVEANYEIDSAYPSYEEPMTVNGLEATYEFNAIDEMSNNGTLEGLTITAVLEEDIKVPTIVGTFNNLHELDNTNLRKLQKVIVTSMSADSSTKVSPEQYIINVVRLPLPIPDDLKSPSDRIIVGETEVTDLETMKIKTDSLSYSLGQISTPKKYNNLYDYMSTKCLLHLPYCQTIEIEPNYVIGETVTIMYELSLYDGVGTVNIYSSKIDDVIISEVVKVGTVIPFFNRDNGQYTTKSMDLLSIYNKLKYAYMEVLRNVPANIDNPFNTMTKKVAMIGDMQGFIKAKNVLLESTSIGSDKEKILSLLEDGVIIK